MKRIPALVCAVLALVFANPAPAQPYPSRPIRIILPFGPGSSTDVVARIYGEKLAQRTGQGVIIENRVGAAGAVAAQAVATSPHDGYTLLQGSNGSHGINVSVFAKLPYDPIKDFEPVTQIGQVPFVLAVRSDLPVKNFAELIALAKSKPGMISLGSTASASELAGTLLGQMAGVTFNRIPYKAPGQALVDLLANRLDVLFETPPVLAQHVQAGTIRALAVSSKKRSALLPTVPSVAESGLPDYEAVGLQWLFVPAGTPKAVIRRLNTDVTEILNTPDVRDLILSKGVEVATTTPEQLGELVKAEIEKWKRLFREADLKPISPP